MNRELIAVIDEIGRQKGIDKARVIGAIESALQTAAKKRFGQAENIQVGLLYTSPSPRDRTRPRIPPSA